MLWFSAVYFFFVNDSYCWFSTMSIAPKEKCFSHCFQNISGTMNRVLCQRHWGQWVTLWREMMCRHNWFSIVVFCHAWWACWCPAKILSARRHVGQCRTSRRAIGSKFRRWLTWKSSQFSLIYCKRRSSRRKRRWPGPSPMQRRVELRNKSNTLYVKHCIMFFLFLLSKQDIWRIFFVDIFF